VGARFVLVLGPDELAKNEVSVKDLRSGEQRALPRRGLAEELRTLLR
jgi:histidyl-tRNA synthetase